VRLDSIDCPEDGQPWGNDSKFGLIKLIGGRNIRLEPHGHDEYERMFATVYVKSKSNNEWINVNAKMIVCGHAWVMRGFYKHLPKERQNDLNSKERWAKSKK
jgi:micrococcal nuclease